MLYIENDSEENGKYFEKAMELTQLLILILKTDKSVQSYFFEHSGNEELAAVNENGTTEDSVQAVLEKVASGPYVAKFGGDWLK